MINPSTVSKRRHPVIAKAYKSLVWDIDGNEYLDFTGSNQTVILGHKQFEFKKAPNFPGVSILEETAKSVLSKYTKTKYFRFFKNGHNAVDCAIRLARHILGKPAEEITIAFLGYHGTGNEFAWTLNPNGIPEQNVINFSKRAYDFENGIPFDIVVYEPRFKEAAMKVPAMFRICDTLKDGINALYQKHDADFVLYGKSIANGYPIAVLTGRDELMSRIDEIYYSTTFGGENTGLEAMLLTIKEFSEKRNKWLELKKYADEVLPAWYSLNQEEIDIFRKGGILNNGFWQIMTCHTEADIDKLGGTYL